MPSAEAKDLRAHRISYRAVSRKIPVRRGRGWVGRLSGEEDNVRDGAGGDGCASELRCCGYNPARR